ncbi:hypothetical protein [Qipengyuania soli]|uniref:Uncharacterized protein n=1 Tax=Qipengyuania soli TaxID=2782568 RepID=A0A7S8ISE9_9SPHN|nr:hypothetical protein [Qipengyuania soli]QPC98193.1 hypothetical protein IRL76_09980 [Qipengyuania soli]
MVSRFNVKSGASDLWEYIREPRPYRWTFLFMSFALTFGLLWSFMQESVFVPPDKPRVVFISTFAEGRSDEEIRRTNLENQKRKEAREAELAKLREKKVDAYKALGRATGVDVDSMAAQAKVDNAREAAAAEARQKELYQASRTVGDKPE